VSVIDVAACNATHTRGCQGPWPTVAVGAGPLALALDHATSTLFVTNTGGNTVSMINATTCNATNTAGCNQAPPTVAVGGGPGLLAVDQATNTIYVPNGNDGTVSVINGATCNATDTSGCARTSTVTAGSGAGAVALDDRTHTAYVANFNDGTVSVIDTESCKATATAGCGQTAPKVAVGVQPAALVADQPHNTVYVQFGPGGNELTNLGSLALIDSATCNATDRSGCGRTPPTTPVGSGATWIAENAATHTVYAVNQEDSTVSVIDTNICNATDTAGCRETPPAMAIGFNGGGADIDPTTDTIYATSQAENTVSVLNGATCNATNTSGCTRFAPTTTVGTGPQGVAANSATHTVYATNRSDDTVSVIDTAACNATHTRGCRRAWPTIRVGNYAQDIRVNQRTNTIYVVNANDNTVSVIDGATCNSSNTSGCSQRPPTVAVGSAPYPVAVDEATDTIYVGNRGDSTVSLINGATCNRTITTGCAQAPPTVAVGGLPFGAAVDQRTGTVYLTSIVNSDVQRIDDRACNATNIHHCDVIPVSVRMGGWGGAIALEPSAGSAYVPDNVDGTVSFFPLKRR
jgi:YVTN family beta-propeller protein